MKHFTKRNQMSAIAANLARAYPDDDTGFGVRLVSLHEDMVVRQRPALLLLQGSVGGMLLVASFNWANLLLSRALSRRRELAIRASLGASRWRLVQQLLAESLLLAAVGGILGVVFAHWGVELFTLSAKTLLPRSSEIQIDTGALCFTLLLSLLEETDSGIGHPGKILTASLSLPPALHATDSSVRSFHQNAQQKMVQIPGVRSAGAISLLPLIPGDTDTSFQIVGRPIFLPVNNRSLKCG
jgi:hypothetical protein